MVVNVSVYSGLVVNAHCIQCISKGGVPLYFTGKIAEENSGLLLAYGYVHGLPETKNRRWCGF